LAIDVSSRSKPSTAPSLLRLAAIQYFERVKDSAGLAPKSGFIATEPIKSEVGKIGKTQKATSELDSGSVDFHPRIRQRFYVPERIGSWIGADGIGSPEHCVNYLTRIWQQLAALPIVIQMLSLDLE